MDKKAAFIASMWDVLMKGCDFYKRFWQDVICPVLKSRPGGDIFEYIKILHSYKNLNVTATMAKLLTMAIEVRFSLVYECMRFKMLNIISINLFISNCFILY